VEADDTADYRSDALAIAGQDEPGIVSRPAVWADSDDERMAISLEGHKRLRKLRTAESDDVVNGTEYIRRLRTQYLRLHPTPDWANPEIKRKQRKKRAGSNSGSEDGLSGSASEMDTDDDETNDLSVKPLAKLLQGAGDLVRGSEAGMTGKPVKLRQEVIDIARLKDVGGVQPVSARLLLTYVGLTNIK
jgi:U3 small nucleolar RNA-associated protein 18